MGQSDFNASRRKKRRRQDPKPVPGQLAGPADPEKGPRFLPRLCVKVRNFLVTHYSKVQVSLKCPRTYISKDAISVELLIFLSNIITFLLYD